MHPILQLSTSQGSGCNTVQHCTVQYCTVQYCTVQYCTVQHRTLLSWGQTTAASLERRARRFLPSGFSRAQAPTASTSLCSRRTEFHLVWELDFFHSDNWYFDVTAVIAGPGVVWYSDLVTVSGRVKSDCIYSQTVWQSSCDNITSVWRPFSGDSQAVVWQSGS